MSKFWQLHCDQCDEKTTFALVDHVTKTGPSSGLIDRQVKIERGCYHITIDTQLKPLLDAYSK